MTALWVKLFMVICDELEDISFTRAFEVIMSVFKQSLCDYLHLIKSQADAFVEHFISQLPACIMDRRTFSVCES